MFFIGIDLGTSGVKMLLMDEKGKLYKSVTKTYSLSFPQPGWSEQNPKDWWQSCKEGLKELLQDQETSLVAGISFGGQMHGLVLLDERNQVIRPAILWNDGRAVKETNYLNQEIGKEVLANETGNIAFAGFSAPKLLWVRENEAEYFEKIKKILLPKDYLIYQFTGNFYTDYSDASGTLWLNVKDKKWSKKMLEICGIIEEQLPELLESYEVAGEIRKELALELGLPETVKIIAGAGDNAAAAIGTGTVGEGACNISLGTSGTVFVASKKFEMDSNYGLHSFAHGDGNYHVMGCILSAASCNKWWMEEILQNQDFKKEQESIKELGNNHVYFLPYLMGERSPHNDPYARSCFLGMTMDTTHSEMTQAMLEGVAFALRDCLEVAKKMGIYVTKTKLCGGGGKSPLWRKIVANVCNVEVEEIAVEEGPALGAGILAAVGCGVYADVTEAANQVVSVVGSTLPEKELVDAYEKKYQTYQKIYPALKSVFPEF